MKRAGMEKIEKLSASESKGLRCAGITAIIYIIILVVGFFTDVAGFLKGTGTKTECDRTDREEYEQDRDQAF